ncbi:MAG: PAS domain-containing protein [Acidobacteria bacterium]|nr:PAS domain-containing protein [Acidobacteriota bacterium]
MTEYGYALLGLTAIVAVLVAVLAFAVLKAGAGLRAARSGIRGGGGEAAVLSHALEDAVARLKTQERAMSARAAASESLSDQIVESLTAGLLVVDGGGRVVILNRAGRRLLNAGGNPVGSEYRDLLAGALPLGEVIGECLTTGRPIVRRELLMTASGARLHFGVTVSPLSGADLQGAICLFSDLTSVVELEEQVRLKDTLARLGELTAGIAHEFRNGLATIHGYSRLLDPEALTPAYRPYVQGIRQEAEALGQVVTEFLNFARPEKTAFAPAALGRIAQRAGDDLRHELPANTRVELTGEFADLQGDEVLLRQMFGNLIRNAAEACAAAGVRPHIVIRGSVDRARGVCRVAVEDNGPGIPEADRARVFQPFFTTRARGTGLGLSVVQKIVVTHNGRVSVGASPAGGASIEVTLPLLT